ncbi:hypothetical protein E2C01_004650 [Portunus trituberculatus]|uniref:Uncharacterized protein n=1 Tax=Portunus trituberculatus TaxID=210409 RepID=A0A5B7CWZ7_PORTR|nr:hypothetical protein [Portunus trituberculatus]
MVPRMFNVHFTSSFFLPYVEADSQTLHSVTPASINTTRHSLSLVVYCRRRVSGISLRSLPQYTLSRYLPAHSRPPSKISSTSLVPHSATKNAKMQSYIG